MFIAMNNFRVHADRADDFVTAWRERESFLDGTDGFVSFHLLELTEELEEGVRLYASHTVWRDEAAFRAWVDSEAFRKAHAQGKLTGILADRPQLRCWTSVDLG